MDVGKIVNFAIEYGPKITGIVKGIKALFGGRKSGQEKKKIAVAAALDAIGILEGVSAKDYVNQEKIESLVDRSVEVAYKIMKLEEELRAIAAEVKELRGNGLPPA
jgi:hypothetical protein